MWGLKRDRGRQRAGGGAERIKRGSARLSETQDGAGASKVRLCVAQVTRNQPNKDLLQLDLSEELVPF